MYQLQLLCCTSNSSIIGVGDDKAGLHIGWTGLLWGSQPNAELSCYQHWLNYIARQVQRTIEGGTYDNGRMIAEHDNGECSRAASSAGVLCSDFRLYITWEPKATSRDGWLVGFLSMKDNGMEI